MTFRELRDRLNSDAMTLLLDTQVTLEVDGDFEQQMPNEPLYLADAGQGYVYFRVDDEAALDPFFTPTGGG